MKEMEPTKTEATQSLQADPVARVSKALPLLALMVIVSCAVLFITAIVLVVRMFGAESDLDAAPVQLASPLSGGSEEEAGAPVTGIPLGTLYFQVGEYYRGLSSLVTQFETLPENFEQLRDEAGSHRDLLRAGETELLGAIQRKWRGFPRTTNVKEDEDFAELIDLNQSLVNQYVRLSRHLPHLRREGLYDPDELELWLNHEWRALMAVLSQLDAEIARLEASNRPSPTVRGEPTPRPAPVVVAPGTSGSELPVRRRTPTIGR